MNEIRNVISLDASLAEGLALASTIIILAHALKLKVVAEGVETDVDKVYKVQYEASVDVAFFLAPRGRAFPQNFSNAFGTDQS